jgi:Tol biopolymer transport system component
MRIETASTLLSVLLGFATRIIAQETTRVSVATNEVEADAFSVGVSMSSDGRYVVFASAATNFAPNNPTNRTQIYVRDRDAGTTTLVSVNLQGSFGNSQSTDPSITPDGRFVVFESAASDLVPEDSGTLNDVFVRDLRSNRTVRASVNSTGHAADDASVFPSMSADGRFVTFASRANNLVPEPGAGGFRLFVHDLSTGETTLGSVDSLGGGHSAIPDFAPISSDGRFLAFTSDDSDIVPGDTNARTDVFVHDRQSGITERVNVSSEGDQGIGTADTGGIALSLDGRFVAFTTNAANLVPGDGNGSRDVFVHDRRDHSTRRISVRSDGSEGDGQSYAPAICADGRHIAFASFAALVPDDTNGLADGYLRDLQTGETIRLSVSTDGVQGNRGSPGALDHARFGLSGNARYVAFESNASNLVPGDSNNSQDVFVRDRGEVCGAGTVANSIGSSVPVLRVNGEALVAGAPIGAPMTVTLDASPAGPNPAHYVVWVWKGTSQHSVNLVLRGQAIGCLVNPTPFQRFLAPQPVQCLRGDGVPAAACRNLGERAGSPSSAPWVFTRPSPPKSLTLTLQGLIEDHASSNLAGISITNAVTVVPFAPLPPAGPENDECTAPLELPSDGPFPHHDSEDVTFAAPASEHSVWFRWTPAIRCVATFKTCGSDYDTLVDVFTDPCGAFGSLVASNDDAPTDFCEGTKQSFVNWAAAAGTTYTIRVRSAFGTRAGQLEFTLDCDP